MTLHLLNDPEYIQLLVNPMIKMIAIRKGDANDPLSLRIDYKKLLKDSYELHSKELLESLLLVYENWEDGYSYRIRGFYDEKNRIAQFRINDMKRIREAV